MYSNEFTVLRMILNKLILAVIYGCKTKWPQVVIKTVPITYFAHKSGSCLGAQLGKSHWLTHTVAVTCAFAPLEGFFLSHVLH